MSLRARLTIGVVALAALGLLVAGAVTYAEQRSSLFDRIDEQVRGALGAVGTELEEKGIRSRAPMLPARPRSACPARQGPGGRPRGDGRPGAVPAREPAPRSTARRATPPAACWATCRPRLPAGETAPADPKLPAKIRTGEPITVGSVGSGGLRYRVIAAARADGGPTIAAMPLTEVDATLSQLLLIEGLVFSGVLLALGFGAWWIVRLGLRPLDAIGVTAGAIAAGDLTRRVDHAEPRTEVGRLGLSLNAMLARLEEAFAERRASEERLRRFLADASHELRTPLSSIRGYAELFRIGAASRARGRREGDDAHRGRVGAHGRARRGPARARAPGRGPRAGARAGRPGGARGRRGRRRPRGRARARDLAARRGDDAVVVDGDPGQLRQVLANLMRNALVHTPAGTPIEVSVRARDGDATLAVRDYGPGLPTDDPSELFDRFWRADPGRGRGRAGAGLGLAIVAGVVAAHGGRARRPTPRAAARASRSCCRCAARRTLTHALSAGRASLPPVLKKVLRRGGRIVRRRAVRRSRAPRTRSRRCCSTTTTATPPPAPARASRSCGRGRSRRRIPTRRTTSCRASASATRRSSRARAQQAADEAREHAEQGRAGRQPADRAPLAARDVRRAGHGRGRQLHDRQRRAPAARLVHGAARLRDRAGAPRASSTSTRRRAAVRYVGADKRSSRTLGSRSRARRRRSSSCRRRRARHRVAWTAELSLRDADGDASTSPSTTAASRSA